MSLIVDNFALLHIDSSFAYWVSDFTDGDAIEIKFFLDTGEFKMEYTINSDEPVFMKTDTFIKLYKKSKEYLEELHGRFEEGSRGATED